MKSTTVLLCLLTAAVSSNLWIGVTAFAKTNAIPQQDALTVHNAFIARNTMRDAVDLILGYKNPNASAFAKEIAEMAKKCQIADQYNGDGHVAHIGGDGCPLRYDSTSTDVEHFNKTFEIVDNYLAEKLAVVSSSETVVLVSHPVTLSTLHEDGVDHITIETLAHQHVDQKIEQQADQEIELTTKISVDFLVEGSGGSRHFTPHRIVNGETLNFNGRQYDGSLTIVTENRGFGHSHEVCSFDQATTHCGFLAYLFGWDYEFDPIP